MTPEMSMEIRLIDSKEIDAKRWDELVQKTGATVYNHRHYLDSLSENWLAVIWGDYDGAIAIPYSIRLGIKGIFTPNFIRALDWMGQKPGNMVEVEKILKQHFKRADFNVNQQLFSDCEERIYQNIASEDLISLGSQTKRGIKKFEKTALSIEKMKVEDVFPLVVSELRSKVKDLNDNDFQRFEKLLFDYDRNQCTCYGIRSENLHAAIILIEWDAEVLYIKGGVDEFGKQNGLMHALMFDAIQRAFKKGKSFSFEGSFVSSVRQFNLGFGAADKVYYNWEWDNSPWWFRLLLKLKKYFKQF